jgi:hypothetical protein
LENCVDVSLCTGSVAFLKLILRIGNKFHRCTHSGRWATMIGTLARITVAALKTATESAKTFEIFIQLS